ncbi:MAG TPA: helix-turn-helix transcriptional regulator, partial [Thermohalobaculum sp.]|nr:helix-turn-helix transcriptional regulator [Thermohalobaculum sp.]
MPAPTTQSGGVGDIEPAVLALLDYVELVKSKLGWTPSYLAVKAGLSPSTLNKRLNDPRNASGPSLKTIYKLEAATGIPFRTTPGRRLPLKLALAAAFSEVNENAVAGEVPVPADFRGSTQAFAARVLDDSCDRRFKAGTLLACEPLADPQKQLHNGVDCVVEVYRTTRRAGEIIERRIMTLFRAPGTDDLTLTAPKLDRATAPQIILPRGEGAAMALYEPFHARESMAAGIDYEPQP